MKLTVSFLLATAAAFSAAAPTLSERNTQDTYKIKDSPGLSDSKSKPLLFSGNLLITPDPVMQLFSAEPNRAEPPSLDARIAARLDILRGSVALSKDFRTGKQETTTTINVFEVPEEARGKYCSFHFMFGNGDSGNNETAILFSLDGYGNKFPEEFKTTWNNRPFRNHAIAEFSTNQGPQVAPRPDLNDAKFQYFQAGPIQHLTHLDEVSAFKCDPIIGRTAWEIVPAPRREEGGLPFVGTMAWSMNKGLSIEVHGVPKKPL